MRRIALGLTVVALTLTACQDAQQPPTNFQVSDGSAFGGKTGNPRFFFLPPIVPEPDYTGTFDKNLLPYLSLTISEGYLDDQFAGCGETPLVIGVANGLYLDEQLEAYRYDWKTNGLTEDQVHRLCVVLDPPGTGPGLEPITLGFRDVSPTQGGGGVAEDPVYLFNSGSNVPIKFRVEKGVLNADLCPYYETIGNDYDCTAQILASNETAVCDNATCEITTGYVAAPELFLIEKFALDNPLCFEENGTSTVAGFPLDIDIPQYAGCVRVTIFDADQSFNGFINDTYGTVGACFYPTSGSPVKIAQGQDEAIQMHIQYPDPDTVVWALPWGSTGGIFEECEIVETQTPSSGSLASRITAGAREAWRGAQQLLNPWFAPPVVYAFHTGFGGHTTLKSSESSLDDGTSSLSLMSSLVAEGSEMDEPPVTEQVFSLAWALPSQMEDTLFCAGIGCTTLATSPLTVRLDQTVTVAVKVTDNGAVADAQATGGRSLGEPRPVEGARVHFAVSTDPNAGASVYSDADGIARFTWVANTTAPTTITASGFGIGTTGGPYDAFVNGAYQPELATQLARGTLGFDVRVCPAGADVNGSVGASEYADTVHFRAKVSGGETDAWLYWTYDCDNVYFALEVVSGSELANELRLVFDNLYGSGATVNDDQWNLRRDSKNPLKFLVADRFLSQSCVGSKQSDCGTDDIAVSGGTNDIFNRGVVGYSNGVTVFELSRPLVTGDARDFQVNLGTGTELGLYVVLQLGKGAQGNTEFPGFRDYLKIPIGPLP